MPSYAEVYPALRAATPASATPTPATCIRVRRSPRRHVCGRPSSPGGASPAPRRARATRARSHHTAEEASASRMAATGIERASLPFPPMEPLRIGVLAVQGNFREHAAMLRRLGAAVVEVRKPDQLEGLDGLVIPGGESTTFMRLMRLYGLDEAIRTFTGPVFGTCAGMIILDRDH